MNTFLCQNFDLETENLLTFLKKEFSRYKFASISICVAYATRKGVIDMRSILPNQKFESEWLFGLDDRITEPEAILFAQNTVNSIVKVKKMQPTRRFHPKIYLLKNVDNSRCTLIIGSNNLTMAGLNKNCEAFMVFRSTSIESSKPILKFWEKIWRIGKVYSPSEIEAYKQSRRKRKPAFYEIAKESFKKPENKKIKAAQLPNILKTSRNIWQVLGRNTGPKGNQLDILRVVANFLNLPNPVIKKRTRLKLNTERGSKFFNLQFTKGMWRIMNFQSGFDNIIRPNPNKASPYIVLFEKNSNNTIGMKIFRKNSSAAKNIRKKSIKIGLLGSSNGTPSREYGLL